MGLGCRALGCLGFRGSVGLGFVLGGVCFGGFRGVWGVGVCSLGLPRQGLLFSVSLSGCTASEGCGFRSLHDSSLDALCAPRASFE